MEEEQGEGPPSAAQLGATAQRAGLGRVNVLAWRDLADTEAGGSEVHADRIASAWAAAGIDVTLRTSTARGLPRVEVRNGYRVVRRSGRNLVFPSAVRDQLAGRLGPADAVVEVWNGVPWLTPVWCRVPHVAFIHHVHVDMWDLSLGPTLARIGRTLERRAAPLYRHTPILTPSQASKDHIVEYLRLPARNVRVVPPGIDPWFTPGGTRAAAPTVLVVGRLVPHKRVEDLLDLLPDLTERIPDVRLEVGGEGYHRGVLEQHARDLGVDDRVAFLRAVSTDDLVDAYRRAWVVTSASIAEGWGMTITEAAACGTPAVVLRTGGHSDAVEDGVSGLLADSPAHLAGLLADVLDNPPLLDQLSEGAHKRASKLSWDATAAAVLEALADASAGAARR
jgi:glycosyltransferase involved in cell wall biosynthesis